MTMLFAGLALTVLVDASTTFSNIDAVVPEDTLVHEAPAPAAAKGDPATHAPPVEDARRFATAAKERIPARSPAQVQELLLQTGQSAPPTICPVGKRCTFHINMHSNTEETDNSGSYVPNQMNMSFDMTVARTGANTYRVTGSNFADSQTSTRTEENIDYSNDVASFSRCLRYMRNDLIHSNGNFSAIMHVLPGSPIPNTDEGCAEDAQEFNQYTLGAFNALATPATAATAANRPSTERSGPVELLEFADVLYQPSGKKTTHYWREVHQDGSVTVHRQYNMDFTQDAAPAPLLLQSGDSSFKARGSGAAHVNADGEIQRSNDTVTSNIGEDSPNGLPCNPEGGWKSCETAEADAHSPHNERVRMETTFDLVVVKTGQTALHEELEELEELLQRHRAAGRTPVPLHELTSRPRAKRRSEPFDVDKGMPSFVEYLEAAPVSEYEKSGTKKQLEKTMRSPQIRARVVNLIQQGGIRNQRAVQALMHVIGRVGVDDATAVTQLVQMASNKDLKKAARHQALMALVQSKCYDHDHAIQALDKLTRDPKSDVELVALHVKYGLIGHAEHCAHGAYGQANNYRMLLQEAQEHLSNALNTGNEQAIKVWLTAIGNTNSQHVDDTTAVVAAAKHQKLAPPLRMCAGSAA